MVAITQSANEQINIVIVGHVDHGKSTLLGRLYADTGSLPDGKLEKVQEICRRQGKAFEYAFLFDAFLEEQEQGITIDTARTFFSWLDREYIVIDAPGHKEFLKNMVSGAARAEAALLVVDVHEGVQEQSRKHGLLLSLLGLRQVAVVVNKMDLVDYSAAAFREVETKLRDYLAQLGVDVEWFVPVSARQGDNVAERSTRLDWYDGPTVLDTLGLFHKERARDQQPLRYAVQDVYKFDERRVIAGRVAAGSVAIGDRLIFSPSGKSAVVQSIEGFSVDPPVRVAVAGQSTGLTLDEQIFIERGEIASHEATQPTIANVLHCNLFWMGDTPLEKGPRYLLRLATQETECEVTAVHRIVDATDLDSRWTHSSVGRNEVAELTIRTKTPLALDRYQDFEVTGRFVLVHDYDVAGGGIITDASLDLSSAIVAGPSSLALPNQVASSLTSTQRAANLGHRSAVVILQGANVDVAPVARELEQRLVEAGRHAYLLDGGRVRSIAAAGASERPELHFEELLHLLLDTGLIVLAPVSEITATQLDSLRDRLNADSVLLIRSSGDQQNADLRLELQDASPPSNANRVIDLLTERHILPRG